MVLYVHRKYKAYYGRRQTDRQTGRQAGRQADRDQRQTQREQTQRQTQRERDLNQRTLSTGAVMVGNGSPAKLVHQNVHHFCCCGPQGLLLNISLIADVPGLIRLIFHIGRQSWMAVPFLTEL